MKKRIVLILFFSLILTNILFADEPTAITTFESIGIYWTPPGASDSKDVSVKYRVNGDDNLPWLDGLEMKHRQIVDHDSESDPDEKGEYRGSIVNLTPNTTYEIRLTLDVNTTATFIATTWKEVKDLTIGDIHPVGNGSSTYTISHSPEDQETTEYALYDGTNLGNDGTNSEINVNDTRNYCIKVVANSHHIIIRGFDLVGAHKHGIYIENGCHDIIIENCDITYWGYKKNGYAHEQDAGIRSDGSDVKRIIIQRCRIYTPRTDANSWKEKNYKGGYHPYGPQAVVLNKSGGNHVIRYNEFYSDNEHMFNDIIGSKGNASFNGFPTADTDIYGNYLSHCWDDAIEVEGADRNVRVWGNYFENFFVGIANAPVSTGPLYVWGNTSGRSFSPDSSREGIYGQFMKMGATSGKENMMQGYTYIFNNTILQPNGEGSGGIGTKEDHDRKIHYCIAKNNILHVRDDCERSLSNRSGNTNFTYSHNLWSEGHPAGENKTPTYINGASVNVTHSGSTPITVNYFLESGSDGFNDGTSIPNFTTGSSPDMGAFEHGNSPREYGVNAYPNGNNPPSEQQDGIVGQWDFNDSDNLTKATVGIDLMSFGSPTAVAGQTNDNGAVSLDNGDYFSAVTTAISHSGEGSKINTYTLLMDIKIDVFSGSWASLVQTDMSNGSGNDGDLFVRSNEKMGNGSIGYSNEIFSTATWYRMVLVVKEQAADNVTVDIYLNGNLAYNGNTQDVDTRLSLEDNVLLFCDNNGEEQTTEVSKIVLYNYALSDEEISVLGEVPSEASSAEVISLDAFNSNIVTGTTSTKNDGYTGDGYANVDNEEGTYMEWEDININTTGTYNCTLRYASSNDRPGNVKVNGEVVATFQCSSTGNFQTWGTETVSFDVDEGSNTIRLTGTTSSSLGNVDKIDLELINNCVNEIIEVSISSSYDDAKEKADGTVRLESNQLEMVHVGSGDQTIGLRFTNIDIPQGAVIDNAYLEFTANQNRTGACTFTLEGEAVDNSSQFSESDNNLSDRNTTDASEEWNPVDWTEDLTYQTPDLKDIVQEIVNRNSWASGNSLAIIITGNGSSKNRKAYSFDDTPDKAAKLHVEYSSIGMAKKVAKSEIVLANLTWELAQNYPNPFNPSTNISFTVPEASHVKIVVYDMLGREIAKVVDDFYESGNYNYSWMAKDENGIELSSGIYIARIQSGSFVKSIKMILLR